MKRVTSQSFRVPKVTLKPATLCSLKPILAGLSIVESVLGSSPSLGRLWGGGPPSDLFGMKQDAWRWQWLCCLCQCAQFFLQAEVSIISKIWVFYKNSYWGFEFFIKMRNWVFYKKRLFFIKSARFHKKRHVKEQIFNKYHWLNIKLLHKCIKSHITCV